MFHDHFISKNPGTKYDSHPRNPDMSFQKGIKVRSNPTTFRMGLEPSTLQ